MPALARRMAVLTLCVALLAPPPRCARAEGTPAGSSIVSRARVTFDLGTGSQTRFSNEHRLPVQELLDLRARWADANPIVVSPGDSARVLHFVFTNAGNGFETLNLAALGEIAGDDFDPLTGAIHLDGDGDGVFDPDLDPIYLSGSDATLLAADDSLHVFLLSDIPTSLDLDDEGLARLSAAALTGSGAPGTLFPGEGDYDTDAVVGFTGALAEPEGSYLVSTVYVHVAKSATVADPFGGDQPVTGAVITYTLEITASGAGTAMGVVLVDSLGANASYRSGSLTLNSTNLTDANDGDAGNVSGTAPGVVTVSLGDLGAGGATQVVKFDVTIH